MAKSPFSVNKDRLVSALENPIFALIAEVANRQNKRAFVIGGYVRDILLGRPCKDIDIVTEGSGMELAEEVGKKLGCKVTLFKNFGTAHFRYQDLDVEFVGARKESYQRESRKPIVEEGSLEDDQNRRDFTINALAIGLNQSDFGKLIDPFGGVEDLENGIIRTPLDPDITYSDDPLRMMRAIRFSSQLQFTIEEKSFEAIARNKQRIEIISKERISDELNKIILSPIPSHGFTQLFDTGLLELIFPEMANLYGVEEVNGHKHKDNFYHTLQVLDNLSKTTDQLWLRWAAILHDIAKPPTKKYYPDQGWTFHGHEDLGSRMVPGIFKRLKLPLDHKMKYVQKLVFLHLRPIALTNGNITDSAVRRLLFEVGDDLEDLMKLCEADITTKNKAKEEKYLQRFKHVREVIMQVEERDRIRNWQPPITGELIMQSFNLKPGHEVGIIKNKIREAILDGQIKNDFEEALQLMYKLGTELGLKRNN
ncbi:MAG: CCA tRNA nucleotidyltransferase [Flavobacteriales bacterium]|nr:CCA tRNA nucleotidyltransferase [Flavobacteriales bacterium]